MSNTDNVEIVFSHIKKYGKLDILVNSAGVSQKRKFDEITITDWQEVIDNNATNTFLSVEAIKLMKENSYGKLLMFLPLLAEIEVRWLEFIIVWQNLQL